MLREQLKAKIEAKTVELKRRRQERLQTTTSSTSFIPNLVLSPTDTLTTPREVTDPNKIFEEVGTILSRPLLTISSSSPQQKLHPSTNIPLQICPQPLATINIPPKELITYSKIVQTDESAEQDSIANPIQRDHSESDGECAHLLKQSSLQCPTSLIKDELTNNKREQILKSEQFQEFFSRTSLLIERSLWDSPRNHDIFKDYSEQYLDEQNERMNVGEIIKFNGEFFDQHWSHHRIVTGIDTSTYHPELILASYSKNYESSYESDGLALIWNTNFKSKPTPEYVFNCQSWVTSCVFSKSHPNILLGGTYSGQIVVWDTRVNKRTPVQHTASSTLSHTHPVYCLKLIDTQNTNSLISVSNEGKMCSWNINMMTQPQESIDLAYRMKSVAATRIAFPNHQVNHFIIGSEEGQAYSGSRYGDKTGIHGSYEGHFGPITGLSCHNVDDSSLFLTSSFDWTVKLWSLNESKPLHSFEVNSDYVADVHWSPVHPSVFLTCDITGRFDLWNLNYDSELPLFSTTVDGNVAFNKCVWSPNGQQIILGDDQGKLRLYAVNEFLTNPDQDDFDKLTNTLQKFKPNTFDDNHLTKSTDHNS